MKKKLLKKNKPQRLQLERVKLGSFNNFNGELIAKDLAEHEDLWESFMFGNFEYGTVAELRELPYGLIKGDTLMVLVDKDKLQDFLNLTKSWHVDEVGWSGRDEIKGYAPFRDEKEFFMQFDGSPYEDKVILRLWWD